MCCGKELDDDSVGTVFIVYDYNAIQTEWGKNIWQFCSTDCVGAYFHKPESMCDHCERCLDHHEHCDHEPLMAELARDTYD